MRRKLFLLIFVFGMSVFVAANVFDYWRTKPACCDFSAAFGVPWALGRWGGYVGTVSIDWRRLLADIFIAGMFSETSFPAPKFSRLVQNIAPH